MRMKDVAEIFKLLEDNARIKRETTQKLSSKDIEIQKQYIVYALSTCSNDDLEMILQKSKDQEKCKHIFDCVQKWKCMGMFKNTISIKF